MNIGKIHVGLDLEPKEVTLSKLEGEKDKLVNVTSLTINFSYDDKHTSISFGATKRRTKIFVESDLPLNTYLGKFYVNKTQIHIFTDSLGGVYVSRNPNHFLRYKRRLIAAFGINYLYIFGHLTNSKRTKDYNQIYIGNKRISHIYRPLNTLWKLKNIALIRIPISEIVNSDSIHNTVMVGDTNYPIVNLRFLDIRKNATKGMRYYSRKIYGDKVLLARSTIRSKNMIITQIPYEREYSRAYTLKIYIAKTLSKITPNRKINLFFEKESERAQESGYYMFEKIVKYASKHNLKSSNYFILDPDSAEYSEVKSKYGKLVVEKYSFRHCYYIFKSSYFISSEMSNHVINARLYNRTLNRTINKKTANIPATRHHVC